MRPEGQAALQRRGSPAEGNGQSCLSKQWPAAVVLYHPTTHSPHRGPAKWTKPVHFFPAALMPNNASQAWLIEISTELHCEQVSHGRKEKCVPKRALMRTEIDCFLLVASVPIKTHTHTVTPFVPSNWQWNRQLPLAATTSTRRI